MYYCLKRFGKGKKQIHIHPYPSIPIRIVSSSYTSMIGAWKPWNSRSLQITHVVTVWWSFITPMNLQVYRPLDAFWLDLWMLGVLVFQLGSRGMLPLKRESTSEPSSKDTKDRIWYNALKAFPPWVLDDMRVLPWDALMPADMSKAFKLCLLWLFLLQVLLGCQGFQWISKYIGHILFFCGDDDMFQVLKCIYVRFMT